VVPGVDEKISASESLVTAYVAQRPQDRFFHPHQEHMKDIDMVKQHNSYNIRVISFKLN